MYVFRMKTSLNNKNRNCNKKIIVFLSFFCLTIKKVHLTRIFLISFNFAYFSFQIVFALNLQSIFFTICVGGKKIVKSIYHRRNLLFHHRHSRPDSFYNYSYNFLICCMILLFNRNLTSFLLSY